MFFKAQISNQPKLRCLCIRDLVAMFPGLSWMWTSAMTNGKERLTVCANHFLQLLRSILCPISPQMILLILQHIPKTGYSTLLILTHRGRFLQSTSRESRGYPRRNTLLLLFDYQHLWLQKKGCKTNPVTSDSVQFSSVLQSCPTLCDPMDCSTPGLPVHHQLLELAQTHVHRVADAIQPSHLLSSPSPTFNFSRHQGIFQGVTPA